MVPFQRVVRCAHFRGGISQFTVGGDEVGGVLVLRVLSEHVRGSGFVDAHGRVFIAGDAACDGAVVGQRPRQENGMAPLAIRVIVVSVRDDALHERDRQKRCRIHHHIRVVRGIEGGGGCDRAVDGREVVLAQNRHAGADATDNNVALCNALVDQLGDGRVTPKRHVVPLIASGKPDALSLCDALVDLWQVRGIGIGEHERFDGVDIYAQLRIQVVVVSVAARTAQHEHVASVYAFEEPRHGVVVFTGAAHQADAALWRRDHIRCVACEIRGVPLGGSSLQCGKECEHQKGGTAVHHRGK